MDYDFDENFEPIRVRIPRYIFRYLRNDDRLISSLQNSELWFSAPSDFNDPFDCRDVFDADNTLEELEWYFAKYTKKHLDPALVPAIAEKAFNDKSIIVAAMKSLYAAKMSQVAACCFSDACDVNLMWSHYAEGHRGVCLVFDTLRFLDNGRFSFLSVDYTNEVPKWNQIRERKQYGGSGYFNYRFDKAFLGTKTLDWKYEREIRLISHSNGLNLFTPDSLIGIIYGTKISAQSLLKITILAKSLYPHLSFSEATIDVSSNSLLVPGFENEILVHQISEWQFLPTDRAKGTSAMLEVFNKTKSTDSTGEA